MKPQSPKFSIQMVKSSRPVGKVFRKSNKNKQEDKAGELKLKNGKRENIRLNVNGRKNGKFNSKSEDINAVLSPSGNSMEVSKKTNVQTPKPEITSLPKKYHIGDHLIKSKTQKRKADEVFKGAEPSHKIAKKTVENDTAKGNKDSVVSSESKVAVTDGSKRNKRRRKKKKKKPSDTNNETANQYKPVLIVKEAKDISGNWKNLKNIIIQQDKKAQLEKLKENEKKFQKPKHIIDKKGAPKMTKKMKKIEKLQLDKMIEEQKRQTEKYQAWKEKLSAKEEEQPRKKKMDDIWFDNVDPILLGEEYNEDENESSEVPDVQEKENVDEGSEGDGKAVAVDCEMVGTGIEGKESMLARVSIVNQYCRVIYDKFVKPQEPVVDYRTQFSGIRPEDIVNGNDFKEVQSEVAKILDGKILVGHGLDNDLKALFLQHPRSRIRDTARYKPFKTMFHGHTPKLKMLAKKILGVEIQTGEHDSVQDAQAVMRIYTIHKKEWDRLKKKVYQKPTKKNVKTNPE
ncbi:uncharacterized protein [Palaemon carinicauda]|uniref:uncharacterized protein n=1 Tax=Palaemon carinicauda TaxID=392227 RepID=UPI0035B678A3